MKAYLPTLALPDTIILEPETPTEAEILKDWHNCVLSTGYAPPKEGAADLGHLLICREI